MVDNFGDIGVAWRLAADLAGRGERVRLFVDDTSALAWMAPGGARGVEVLGWRDGGLGAVDVVVELFGAGLPERVAEAIAHTGQPPVCVNLEHLTAEGFAARSHGLPSPQPARGGRSVTTWFFYPGFDAATGGLLREPGLCQARAAFGSGEAWLAAQGVPMRAGERRVSLFCYPNDALDAMVDALRDQPTLLLVTPGLASAAAEAVLGPSLARGALRAWRLPALTQPGFDRLLWSCDLNLVRGEDSAVRALWAGAPFLWQLYPQSDGAHAAKLEAFLDRLLAGSPPGLAAILRAGFRAWNGAGPHEALAAAMEPAVLAAWACRVASWRSRLVDQPALAAALIGFANSKR